MDDQRTQLKMSESQKIEDPDRLREQIRETRAELDETVHTLQQRLSPDTIKEQVKNAAMDKVETAKEHARTKVNQWQSMLVERVLNNPVPAALVSMGLIWMMKQAANSSSERHRFGRNRNGDYGDGYSLDPYEEWPEYAPGIEAGRIPRQPSRRGGSLDAMKARAQASGQQAKEQISEWTDQAKESLEDWKEEASHRSDEIREHTREQGERMKVEVSRYIQESPLAIGAMAFAIGTAIGLSLPRSEKEDQWMGETRDRLLQEAKATAKEIMPMAKEAVSEAQRAASEAMKEQVGLR
ncbi:DUF3618 domain-containing protein [Candidatus Nitrospira neomarina]|uniref:DUF3618 domain-containing protein n=1 Tax=Candidatus Nitrospira neomarina TaxID=3020899 RepID=A0AA96GIL1_9BACT|nr:DUF3618 domain-containing protein [Candidatus Nitrospira neomarina]WNM62601.1 DUF3618 domain-containing protein [Candidatus Nitrospira neomarina]